MSAAQAYTGDPEVDRLLFSWGHVIRDASGWTRGFALSIQRDRKRPGWLPTIKQLSIMRQLVAELPVELPEDAELIDRDD